MLKSAVILLEWNEQQQGTLDHSGHQEAQRSETAGWDELLKDELRALTI